MTFRAPFALSVIVVSAFACAAPTESSQLAESSDEALSSDVFDDTSCSGAVLGAAEAGRRLSPGMTTTKLGDYTLSLRTRSCNVVSGCTPWAISSGLPWNPGGQAWIDVAERGGLAVRLVAEGSATTAAYCGALGDGSSASCGQYRAVWTPHGTPREITWAGQSFAVRMTTRATCARISGRVSTRTADTARWSEAEIAGVANYAPLAVIPRVPAAAFNVELAGLGCGYHDGDACRANVAEWCRARGAGYTGGFGPVEWSPTTGLLICTGGVSLAATPASIASEGTGCGGYAATEAPTSPACNAAFYRFGRKAGYVGALFQAAAPWRNALLAYSSDDATVETVPWAELTSRHGDCARGAEASGACDAAVHRFCSARGALSGYGPVEFDESGVTLLCFNR